MDDNFSPRVKEVITFSRDEALRLGHDYIGTEHIMLGILRENEGEAITILENLSIDLDFLRNRFEALIPENPNKMINAEKKNIHLTKDRKSTRLNSSHVRISYAVFCLKK